MTVEQTHPIPLPVSIKTGIIVTVMEVMEVRYSNLEDLKRHTLYALSVPCGNSLVQIPI